jgi:hypothetical protein
MPSLVRLRRVSRHALASSFALMSTVGVVSASCAKRTATAEATVSSSSDVLRREEIAKSSAMNAHEAIRLLRPLFLRSRGRTSILRPNESEPVVYLDDRQLGGLAVLRDIPANTIYEVRYFSPAQAQMRWGSGHAAGAILVVTSRAQ